MPSLYWIGKEKVVNHHLDVPLSDIKYKYTFSNEDKRLQNVNSGNKIIHGDNLKVLKALLPLYEEKIKCVYLDPPYNTGNQDWQYNDNVSDAGIKKWLSEVTGRKAEDLNRHDKWLCMMYPRLKLLHGLLAKDGTIFISIDENEISHLRCVMDEIFGEDNFVSQITLVCNPKGRSQDKHFRTCHEYILVYSKTKLPKNFFNVGKNEMIVRKQYRHKDEHGYFRFIELRNTHREFNRYNRPNLFYPVYANPQTGEISFRKNNSSVKVEPLWPEGLEGCWTWSKKLAIKEKHLLVARKLNGAWKIYRKDYAVAENGQTANRQLHSVWKEPEFLTEKGQSTLEEIFPNYNKSHFPQPKPLGLLEEILKTCTGNSDIILDCNAGSGTTAHAVLNLNKQDGASRKFILVEMMDYANELTAERIKRVIKGYNEHGPCNAEFDFYELGNAVV